MADLQTLARALAASGTVTLQDVRDLRMCVFKDGVVSRAEAEALFSIERARSTHNNAWSELFVEALADYAIRQEQPVGYLSDDTAAWLMCQMKLHRQPSMDADVSLVAKIIEDASEVPSMFSAFALRMTKDAVIYGDGADEVGRIHKSGAVDEADVALLKRILWGAGSEGRLAISEDEAEALFAIADATTGADNAPGFDDLFAKAIGNYLIGATGRAVPTRQEALSMELAADYKRDLFSMLGEVVKGGISRPSSMLETLRNARSLAEDMELEHGLLNVRRDVEAEFSSVMTPDKVDWLVDHVGKNGVMNGPEKALVRFISREGTFADPELKARLAKVA